MIPDSSIVVSATATPMVTALKRTFSPTTARPDSKVNVTISGIGVPSGIGQIVEMLPGGFSFEGGSEAVADANPSSRSGVSATVDPNDSRKVTFQVLALDSIKYRVMQ